jgi:hypothetical protein
LYRRHPGNMSRMVSVLETESVRLLSAAFARPDLPPQVRSGRARAFGRNYGVLAGSYFRAGQYGAALRCGSASLRLDWRQGRRLLGLPGRALRRAIRGGRAHDF